MGVDEFIAKWRDSGGHERANYQLFLTELCDLLNVPHPDASAAANTDNRYAFERTLTFTDHTGAARTGYIDLYKADAFVLETKQGVNASAQPKSLLPTTPKSTATGHGKRGTPQWDATMEKAYNQARRYIRHLPAAEGAAALPHRRGCRLRDRTLQ